MERADAVSAAPVHAYPTFHAGAAGSALGRWFSYYTKKHAPAPAPTPAPQPAPEEEPEEAESGGAESAGGGGGGEEPAEKKEKKKAGPVEEQKEEQKEEVAEAPEPETARGGAESSGGGGGDGGVEEPAEKKKAEPVEEQKEEMAEAPEPEAARVESTAEEPAEEPAEETFTPVRPCTLFSAGCSGSTLQCAAPPQPTWPAVNCTVCVVVLCCAAYRLTPLAMVAPAQL